MRKITMTAMLAAVATLLMYLQFPLPFLMPSFVQMDFSELPALIASFAIGPVSGVAVCLIKNLIHLLVSGSGGVGELCNFLLGVTLVVPAGLLYRIRRTRRFALIGCLIGAACMALLSFPLNLYLIYPFYERFMPIDAIIRSYSEILPAISSLPAALLVFNLPFTLVKGLAATGLTFLIYKPISSFINGRT